MQNECYFANKMDTDHSLAKQSSLAKTRNLKLLSGAVVSADLGAFSTILIFFCWLGFCCFFLFFFPVGFGTDPNAQIASRCCRMFTAEHSVTIRVLRMLSVSLQVQGMGFSILASVAPSTATNKYAYSRHVHIYIIYTYGLHLAQLWSSAALTLCCSAALPNTIPVPQHWLVSHQGGFQRRASLSGWLILPGSYLPSLCALLHIQPALLSSPSCSCMTKYSEK